MAVVKCLNTVSAHELENTADTAAAKMVGFVLFIFRLYCAFTLKSLLKGSFLNMCFNKSYPRV